MPNNSVDQYLTHYWSFDNGQMIDQIGSSHMTQGSLTNFTTDRFGCLNSALALNGGWTQVPSGVYFDSPEFTISVWVYPQQIGLYAHVIDFAIGQEVDSIILALDGGSGGVDKMPWSWIKNDQSNPVFEAKSPQKIKENEWQFLTVTFNGNHLFLYINETLVGNFTSPIIYNLPIINRTNCYIGKSNRNWLGSSLSILDNLSFFNKSLSQNEIIELMYRDQKSKIFSI
jgi:hypothetical protein